MADLSNRAAALPVASVFRSMDDALRFAGPLPFTFSYDEAAKKMVVIEGLRKAWAPAPVSVEVREVRFLERHFPNLPLRFSNAFYVENIPDTWKPGVLQDLT